MGEREKIEKMNKKTVSLTKEQYENLIKTIKEGCAMFRPNLRAATCLVIEANLGIRISDVLNLRLNSIIQDGSDSNGNPRYRLNIVEKKTKKKRTFTVPSELRDYLRNYADINNLRPSDILFDVTERQVQRVLKKACDYLGYEGISTHSFRKFYATNVYSQTHDILLVKHLLQHSDVKTSQVYIGIAPERVEKAIQQNLNLI